MNYFMIDKVFTKMFGVTCAWLFGVVLYSITSEAIKCNFDVSYGSQIDENMTCESGSMQTSKSINISINIENNYDYINTHTFVYDLGTEYYNMSTNRVKVAAITMGASMDFSNPNFTQRMIDAKNYLKIAAENNVDIAVLPEEFATQQPLNLYTSNITTTLQSIAKQYNMYIVYGMRIIEVHDHALPLTSIYSK